MPRAYGLWTAKLAMSPSSEATPKQMHGAKVGISSRRSKEHGGCNHGQAMHTCPKVQVAVHDERQKSSVPQYEYTASVECQVRYPYARYPLKSKYTGQVQAQPPIQLLSQLGIIAL